MSFNAASRKDIRSKEKASKQADRTRGEVITALMSNPAGRGYIWDQLSVAHIFSTSFSADALQMAFAEGERNAGLRLLDDILNWCPEQFIQMMREKNVRERTPDPDSGSTGGDSSADAYPDPTSSFAAE